MAIYNYYCPDCNYNFSIAVPMSNKPPDWEVYCPKCRVKGQVKRIFEKFSFVMKGSDYYKTDHTNKSKDSSS
jgi:putative FmdB family regulatory protein